MRDLFQEQLNELKRELTTMGASCEEIIALASQALTGWDAKLVQKVHTIGAQIDESERTIETICMKLLLRQQPVAGDLRQISAALKMITDMERIGDQAADIAEIISHMDATELPVTDHIGEMAQAAAKMVTDSVESFVKKDLNLAQGVIQYDDVVDRGFSAVRKELIDLLRSSNSAASNALDLLMIAKYLERIGDHAVNIAQWVTYAITGEYHKPQHPGA